MGLVDRAAAAGLIVRHDDPNDLRVVRLNIIARGERILAQLAVVHLDELTRLGPDMQSIWQDLEGFRRS